MADGGEPDVDADVELRLAAEHVAWAPTDAGVVVVLDLRSSTYLRLNSSGATIWAELARGATRDALSEHVHETFGIEPSRARADVDAFLADLRRRDLLTEAAPSRG